MYYKIKHDSEYLQQNNDSIQMIWTFGHLHADHTIRMSEDKHKTAPKTI